MDKISKTTYITLATLGGLLLLGNTLFWQSPQVGLIVGTSYLLFCSFLIGSIIVPQPTGHFNYSMQSWSFLFGVLFLFAGIAIFGALSIYLYAFNIGVLIVLLLVIPVATFTPYYRIVHKKRFRPLQALRQYFSQLKQRRESFSDALLVLAYLTTAAIGFAMLYAGQTIRSIQAPWQTVPSPFFLFYFLATAILIWYSLRARRLKLPLLLLITHSFLSLSVALIVYQIGYGFDPFIHQAAERIIALTGTISPTPLYYLGQYSLVIFLNKILLVDLVLLDRLLVPVLAAIMLPTMTFFVFSHWIKKRFALLLSISMLAIPFGSFIMTTPQNLANLLFIITILLSLLYFRGKIPISALFFLSIATLAVHPIAGIPLIVTVFLLGLFRSMYDSYSSHLQLFILVAIVFSFALPFAFLLNGAQVDLSLASLELSTLKPVELVSHSDLGLDIVYFINNNKAFLTIVLLIIGLWQLRKQKLLLNNSPYLIASAVVLLNFVIVRYFMTFPDLRDFDESAFTARLGLLTFYVILPIVLIGIYTIIKRLADRDSISRAFMIFALAGLVSTSLYLSYPRIDQYQPAKFFSLSSSDIKAVNFIEQTAEPEHIVLANQMIGVAAIKEYGFKKYYHNQFYYSMPNGTPRTFYDFYLEMIHSGAKKETMVAAMDEAGVNQAYFVLNKYWRNFDKIVVAAAQTADEIHLIDDGQVTIFTYRR